MGNPHLNIPSFHIAGTNGKGSVAHMINAMLSRAGYRTGLYTSPHLLEINERIMCCDRAIPSEILSLYIDEITEYVESNGSIAPTYFDVLTACAFRYFNDCHAECAVIETGLGGRLDSTNVVMPICSIITDISIDHAAILGNTLSAISREKAGIIKDRVPVVTSNTEPSVLGPIAEAAGFHGSPLYVYNREYHSKNTTETSTGFCFDYFLESGILTSMPGILINHPLGKQVVNSSSAITAAVISRGHFPGLTDDVIRGCINDFCAPGRFQTLWMAPLVIFDPAHNEAALHEMFQVVSHRFPGRELSVIVSLMEDKDIESIMSMMAAQGIRACYYILNDPRCYKPKKGDYPDVIDHIVQADFTDLAAILDRSASSSSLFFFTGSFRLYRTALDYARHICVKCS
ncbi:MAG: hypothetical protein KA369_07535 [Spirochaetes bacterium]|nr:hypothetical protein [Spirochaetota bacterium]